MDVERDQTAVKHCPPPEVKYSRFTKHIKTCKKCSEEEVMAMGNLRRVRRGNLCPDGRVALTMEQLGAP